MINEGNFSGSLSLCPLLFLPDSLRFSLFLHLSLLYELWQIAAKNTRADLSNMSTRAVGEAEKRAGEMGERRVATPLRNDV